MSYKNQIKSIPKNLSAIYLFFDFEEIVFMLAKPIDLKRDYTSILLDLTQV